LRRPREIDWRSLLAELLIVFVGLFAALQIDQWRDQADFRKAETRYLERLNTDLNEFVSYQQKVLQLLERNYRAVSHVNDSLAAGKVIGGDTAQFELGLIYVMMLPSTNMPRSAYDEMVSSGMFVRLRSEPLKRALSNLYATEEYTERNFSWWRDTVLWLERDLSSYVTYRNEKAEGETFGVIYKEPVRRADFDFEAMRADPNVLRGYYWATDVHSDWIGQYQRIVQLAEDAQAALASELEGR
jgi:hypothetical protein